MNWTVLNDFCHPILHKLKALSMKLVKTNSPPFRGNEYNIFVHNSLSLSHNHPFISFTLFLLLWFPLVNLCQTNKNLSLTDCSDEILKWIFSS